MKIFINLVQLSGIFFLLGTILLIISSQTGGTFKSTFWIGIITHLLVGLILTLSGAFYKKKINKYNKINKVKL